MIQKSVHIFVQMVRLIKVETRWSEALLKLQEVDSSVLVSIETIDQ